MDDETKSIVIVISIYLILAILCLFTCYIYVKRLKYHERIINFNNYDLYVVNQLEYENEINLETDLNEECCICLEKMQNNLTKTKCCNKYLHNQCLVDYIIFKIRNRIEITCPLCREKI